MTPPLAARGCFVTGTDTEVGKTRVSAALLRWCADQGWRSAGFKPVAAGLEQVNGQWCNADVQTLQQASSASLTDAQVCPFSFAAACAPNIAADLEGRNIDFDSLLSAAHALSLRADALVIEGVGGFVVPLNAQHDTADLAQAFGLPVVLVVGLRLGCLNHALLTAESVHARGLRLAGWVGNTVDAAMPWVEANLATLRERLWTRYGAVDLGHVPRLPDPCPQALLAHLDPAGLRRLFAQ
ncbi:dethiobiotin synthase [Thiomonas intermedia]|uniref:dethiobiotin synthase n=1 Tax=Thiomonas intermedia TaxID=926 RepID=UPI001C54CCF4|nr:dethiobiotin synthase [Thiomonas intermedia]